jgi:lipopolysaccharide transport system permease protein
MKDVDAIHSTELVEINAPIPLLDAPRQIWRNVREHHHLIANFISRDFRLKYRNSSLGYFWSLLQPLLLSGVYFLLYVIVAGKPEPMAPLWIFLGVVTWSFFAKGLTDSVTCLLRGESMIKQVYFPREIFAITSVGSQLLIAGLSLLVAIPFMVHYGLPPTANLLMVPLGLLLAALLALGVGLGTACLNVVNRDVEHFFRFLTRAGLFLSPVMWTLEKIPATRGSLRDYLALNPLAVPITMVRNGIDGRPLPVGGGMVAYSVIFCVGSFLIGSMIFKRFEATVVKKI